MALWPLAPIRPDGLTAAVVFGLVAVVAFGPLGNDRHFGHKAHRLLSIDIAERDIDVPLSALGVVQANALGEGFAAMDASCRPSTVLMSPYVRAQQTVLHLQRAGAFHENVSVHPDERLREREFGILDRLTRLGIQRRYPEQAELRARLGKFYHRPPGGESWCDVILRLRSVFDTMTLHHSGPGSRVLIGASGSRVVPAVSA